MNTAGYQLATGHSVMPVGGFNRTDPSPTVDEFKALVGGQIHWIGGGGFGPGMNGSSSSGEINTWVSENFKATTVDGSPCTT